MNRESRRAKTKKSKEPLDKQALVEELRRRLNKKVEAEIHKAIENTQEWLLEVVAISLMDEFDFSKEDVRRLIAKVNNQFDCVLAGTVDIEDFTTMCKEAGFE